MPNAATETELTEELTQLRTTIERIRSEVRKWIVGQEEMVDLLLIALLTEGHTLLIGVPGLAKTQMVRALAAALELGFSRIQFTPDLLPSDITGSEILEGEVGGTRNFRFQRGPIFANLVLADEINRTPPRTQAALLEAMQERAVTVGGQTHPLPEPFLVLATQNPIEQEGTFPLPEAQLDRFYYAVELDYPSAEEEAEIVRRTTQGGLPPIEPVCGPQEVLHMQALVPRIAVPEPVLAAAIRLVRATRPGPEAPEVVQRYVAWGAGPRASQDLILGAKAHAALDGRTTVGLGDVVAMLPHVLRHRIVRNFAAERDRIGVDAILTAIRDHVTLEV